MIPDGYNYHALIDGYTFVYRRMPRADAVALNAELRGVLTDELRASATYSVLSKQVVAAEPDVDVSDLPLPVFSALLEVVFGVGAYQQEQADEKNLHDGVYLATRWPWLVKTTCEQCRHWWYDPLTGRTARPDKEPIRRPQGIQTLCECGVCPKGHYDNPVQLSERNAAAVRFHETCEATGTFPHDLRVRRNGHIIAAARHAARSDEESDGAATGRGGNGSQHRAVANRAGAGVGRGAGRGPDRTGSGRIGTESLAGAAG